MGWEFPPNAAAATGTDAMHIGQSTMRIHPVSTFPAFMYVDYSGSGSTYALKYRVWDSGAGWTSATLYSGTNAGIAHSFDIGTDSIVRYMYRDGNELAYGYYDGAPHNYIINASGLKPLWIDMRVKFVGAQVHMEAIVLSETDRELYHVRYVPGEPSWYGFQTYKLGVFSGIDPALRQNANTPTIRYKDANDSDVIVAWGFDDGVSSGVRYAYNQSGVWRAPVTVVSGGTGQYGGHVSMDYDLTTWTLILVYSAAQTPPAVYVAQGQIFIPAGSPPPVNNFAPVIIANNFTTDGLAVELGQDLYSHVALSNYDDEHLYFTNNYNGWSGNPFLLDSDTSTGRRVSLALDQNDYPHLSYYKLSAARAIKVIRYTGAASTLYGYDGTDIINFASKAGPLTKLRVSPVTGALDPVLSGVALVNIGDQYQTNFRVALSSTDIKSLAKLTV
jgi:hypothetical protein